MTLDDVDIFAPGARLRLGDLSGSRAAEYDAARRALGMIRSMHMATPRRDLPAMARTMLRQHRNTMGPGFRAFGFARTLAAIAGLEEAAARSPSDPAEVDAALSRAFDAHLEEEAEAEFVALAPPADSFRGSSTGRAAALNAAGARAAAEWDRASLCARIGLRRACLDHLARCCRALLSTSLQIPSFEECRALVSAKVAVEDLAAMSEERVDADFPRVADHAARMVGIVSATLRVREP